MASFKEIFDLSVSSEFQHRLQIAVLAAATGVAQTPPDNPAYETYMRWARFAFAMPNRAMQQALGFVIMRPEIAEGDATDAQLYTAIAESIPQLLPLTPDVRPPVIANP